MAKIIINVAAGDATDYLEEVIGQIGNGCTSGHVDASTNWDVEWEANESADDLR